MTVDLDAIEAQWKAATPGRWQCAHHGTWEVEAPPNQRVADFGTIDRAEADAVFAAHAHQYIPALVAEVRRLRAEVAAQQQSHHASLLSLADRPLPAIEEETMRLRDQLARSQQEVERLRQAYARLANGRNSAGSP